MKLISKSKSLMSVSGWKTINHYQHPHTGVGKAGVLPWELEVLSMGSCHKVEKLLKKKKKPATLGLGRTTVPSVVK